MSVMSWLKPIEIDEVPESHFVVVHPLDDRREEKVDTSSLRPMPMSATVKLSLMALRAYLVVMVFLMLYHIADLAGAFGRHAH